MIENLEGDFGSDKLDSYFQLPHQLPGEMYRSMHPSTLAKDARTPLSIKGGLTRSSS